MIRFSGISLSGYEVTATCFLGTELLLVMVVEVLRLLVSRVERLLTSLRKSSAVIMGTGEEAEALSVSEQGTLGFKSEERGC